MIGKRDASYQPVLRRCDFQSLQGSIQTGPTLAKPEMDKTLQGGDLPVQDGPLDLAEGRIVFLKSDLDPLHDG